MHQRKTAIILALTGCFIAAPATAADGDKWYASVATTISLLDDANSETVGLPAPILSVETVSKMETGYGIQAAIGREIGFTRFEIEAGYASNASDSYIAIKPPTGEIPADGGHKSLRLMANAYVDFGKGKFRPYVGAGVGYADFKARLFAPRAPFPTEDPILIIDDHKGDWAYQVMAGAAYEISPGVMLTAGYRWMSAGKIHFRDRSDFEVIRDQKGHNFDIGLRFRL
jgi:opacity protein-like surface antigen